MLIKKFKNILLVYKFLYSVNAGFFKTKTGLKAKNEKYKS